MTGNRMICDTPHADDLPDLRQGEEMKTCEWDMTNKDEMVPGCGGHEMDEFRFCPFCGKPMTLKGVTIGSNLVYKEYADEMFLNDLIRSRDAYNTMIEKEILNLL